MIKEEGLRGEKSRPSTGRSTRHIDWQNGLWRLRLAVNVGAWVPLLWLAWDYAMGNLGVNPIQAVEQRTGLYALVFLLLSLACTPLNTLFGWRQAIKLRRPLGLYAFLYAGVHFMAFVGLDYVFDFSLLPGAIFKKPYILMGLAALLILSALALTSFDYWKARLGKNWKRLHRLVYLAGVLVIVHFAWSVKGDLLALQGAVLKPLIFGALLALLLSLRIPPVRRWAARLRSR